MWSVHSVSNSLSTNRVPGPGSTVGHLCPHGPRRHVLQTRAVGVKATCERLPALAWGTDKGFPEVATLHLTREGEVGRTIES